MTGFSRINYSGVVFSQIDSADLAAPLQVREHTLLYICSGKVSVRFKDSVTRLSEGDCVFLKRDHRLVLDAWTPDGDVPFRSIALFFCRKFMLSYYRSVPKNELPGNVGAITEPVLKLDAGPELESLFLSLSPYMKPGNTLPEELAWQKRLEGLRIILRRDRDFYSSLFDFTHQWKIDLMGFMEENYKDDLTLEELARYTGRSLSSFKRDFKRVSDIPPEKWIIRRRLQEAHRLLASRDISVTDAMYESGFTSLAFFSRSYKKLYGYPPSCTRDFIPAILSH